MKKKLLVDVGIVITLLMIVVLVIIEGIVLICIVGSYYDAIRESYGKSFMVLNEDLTRVRYNGAAFEYYADHHNSPEMVELKNKLRYDDSFDYSNFTILDNDQGDDAFNALSDENKLYNALDEYVSIYAMMSYRMTLFDFDHLYLISVDKSGEATVFLEASPDCESALFDSDRGFGTEMEEKPARTMLYKELFESRSTEIEYGFFNSEYNEELARYEDVYYGAVNLVVSTDEHCYLLVGLYDNDPLYKTVISFSEPIMVANVIMILLVDIILILFVYYKAIRPLMIIQKNVQSYTDTKDTERITTELLKIKTKNEFGKIAADIRLLAEEMERYNADNARLAAEQEHAATELETASKIQLSQLTRKFPERSEIEVFAAMHPAKEVGGDFYDCFWVDDDHLALVIADVSGKGVPAALFMMASKTIIHDFTMSGKTPAEILTNVNLRMCEQQEEYNMFVTVWLGILDVRTGKLICCNAGHEYPVIRRANGQYEMYDDGKHGVFIGMIDMAVYRDYELQLGAGDMLFVYTDGVPEATNGQMEQYGTERLVSTLNSLTDASLEGILDAVKQNVDEFVGDAPQFDDLTMLAFRYQDHPQD